jgi:hypothetical protein
MTVSASYRNCYESFEICALREDIIHFSNTTCEVKILNDIKMATMFLKYYYKVEMSFT